ncbi:hypothetical protein YK48G_20510 [Lentilactobacillus fungorum]|uniref:DUF3278 domain-containing protein n=1 Tax=Lentilactobacillus fungorum TaxID=2201250 RepID=A0ABQ3W2I6_9LACO|nr:hypothetical protein YK48G_20510 [Lentilactobacillus fungorum]
MREGFLIKIMRYFFSIRGVLDERNRREINRIATNAFMFLWLYTAIANIAFIFLPQTKLPKSAFIGFAFLNLVIGWYGVSVYVSHGISKLKLNYQEVSVDDYPRAVRKAWQHGAWVGVVSGIVVYVMVANISGFISWTAIGLSLLIVLINWTMDAQREIGHIVKVK